MLSELLEGRIIFSLSLYVLSTLHINMVWYLTDIELLEIGKDVCKQKEKCNRLRTEGLR